MLEKAMISGVTHTLEETLYRVEGVTAGQLFARARRRERERRHDRPDRRAEIVFSAPSDDRAEPARARRARRRAGARATTSARSASIGAGMKSHPGVAAKMFADARRGVGIEPQIVTTSPIKVACHVPPRGRRARRAGAAPRRSSCTGRSGAPACASPRIGVVGATGAVGTVTLGLLAERGYGHVRAFASERSAGSRVPFGDRRARRGGARRTRSPPATSTSASSRSAPPRAASSSRTPCAAAPSASTSRPPSGSADGVPLVVPEVNGDRARRARRASSPTPTAARSRSPASLKPLHDAAGLARVRVATYQSASGAGAQRDGAAARRARPTDTISRWTGTSTATSSTRRRSSATRRGRSSSCRTCRSARRCMRVPVLVGHAEAVWIETEEPLSPERARELLAAAPEHPGRPTSRRRATPPADRRRARRPDPARPRGGERSRPLHRRRQPPQGRGAERDPDRRARARARSARRLSYCDCCFRSLA